MYQFPLRDRLNPEAMPKSMRVKPLTVSTKPRTAPARGSVWYGMNRNHSGFPARLQVSSMPPTKNMAPARNIR